MSDVDRTEQALRMFSAVENLPTADRAEVLRRLVQLPAHAFAVSRQYPAGFLWSCICGERIFQAHGESAADIHARLLQHSNGEDGLQLCATACGRITGKCVWCPEVAR